MEVPTEIKATLEGAGQSHLLQWWPELSEEEKAELIEQLGSFDVNEAVSFYQACVDAPPHAALDGARLSPLPEANCGSNIAISDEERGALFQTGLGLIADGKVAVILLAGGQGTRLGVDYPKGAYDIGLASGASLFQLQADRILKLQELAAGVRPGAKPRIPWVIMTSPATRKDTEAFFVTKSFFGLDPSQVIFFEQGLLPCFNKEGKIILDRKHRVAMAPDGNGGIYRGLGRAGVLDKLAGIEHVHVYCVDNCLVRVADPVFLAFAASLGADAAAKVVEKEDPHEAVGVICQYKTDAGTEEVRVVEYSEISKELAEAREADGKLRFRAGNIAIHYFRLDFLRCLVDRHAAELIHHVAKKKIPFVCPTTGERVLPTAPNGIKMEKFIFDVFRFSTNFGIWAVSRAEEFAPLKNADAAGVDCPSSSRLAIHNLHRRWLEAAGASVAEHGGVEISPFLSYAGEGLGAWRGRTVHTPTFLLPDSHLHHPQ